MTIKISTENIEISVRASYLSEHSIPRENHFFFVYFITIENKGNYAVQLLSRHWDIFDSNGEKREVEGEGVIGETPVLEPGETYEYNSGCNLLTDMGYMKGYYNMKRLMDDTLFKAIIPQFDLIVPAKLN
ncbi:MAG: Co2+/Mg2+ efflux protein ApaG [Sphingobacteriaceae bacterium]|nr:Co2+/Mg2+ efflux protein ApaG [Sphingobacteriaceae bacterium]MBK7819154.1 Co2+/Mg2+ efflux protein ApaG [Sphingobacteriaceae bacterium]